MTEIEEVSARDADAEWGQLLWRCKSAFCDRRRQNDFEEAGQAGDAIAL